MDLNIYFFPFLLRLELFYSVVTVSGVQQKESVIRIHVTHVSTLSLVSFPIQVITEYCRVPCATEQNFLVDPFYIY